jgi:hypothetical protein
MLFGWALGLITCQNNVAINAKATKGTKNDPGMKGCQK